MTEIILLFLDKTFERSEQKSLKQNINELIEEIDSILLFMKIQNIDYKGFVKTYFLKYIMSSYWDEKFSILLKGERRPFCILFCDSFNPKSTTKKAIEFFRSKLKIHRSDIIVNKMKGTINFKDLVHYGDGICMVFQYCFCIFFSYEKFFKSKNECSLINLFF